MFEDARQKRPNMLFVGGPPRSGTTAFTKYLDEHPNVLVCRERFKWWPREQVDQNLFGFENILHFEDGHEKRDTKRRRAVHEELLSRKDPDQVEWLGDKFPGYVNTLDLLTMNNPGASFILMYRPVKEVAESFKARSENPDDVWLGGEDGFKIGVNHWNKAMRCTRDFIESGKNGNVLVMSYEDFFYNNAKCIPLLSRFLEIEFDASVRQSWAESSKQFEGRRREKEPLGEREQELLEEADRDAETYVLNLIEKQWEELDTLSDETGRALVEERRRSAIVVANEQRNQNAGQSRESELRNLEKKVQTQERKNQNLSRRAKAAEQQLETIKSSRYWKLIRKAERARSGFASVLNRVSKNGETEDLKKQLAEARRQLAQREHRPENSTSGPKDEDTLSAIEYEGHLLPPASMRPNGRRRKGSDEVYLESTRWEVDWMIENLGLSASSKMLDLGCGPGRIAIGVLDRIGEIEKYVGVDANQRFIQWAEQYIASAHPTFKFVHVDAKNEFYNPGGGDIDAKFSLPLSEREFDVVCLFSVFTHMMTSDVRTYLGEIHRILKDGGKAFMTANLEDGVPDVEENPVGYRGKTQYKNPLATVRYNRQFFESLLEESGFWLEGYDPTVRKPQRCLTVSKKASSA